MARTYTNSLAETPSSYPTVYTPIERLNKGTYEPITEPFTVPAVADSEGRYRVELDFGINSNVTPVIDCGGDTDLPRIPYPAVPGPSEVGVAVKDVPILEFHSSRAGESGTIEYSPIGSVRTSDWENRIQNELVSLAENLASGSGTLLSGLGDTDIDGSQADGDVLTWDDTAEKWVAAPAAGGGGAWGTISGTLSDQADLQSALDGKATTGDIGTLTTALATKAPFTYVDSGLALKADITSVDADFAAVDTALAGKAATSHTHNASAIDAGTLDAARLPTGIDAAKIGDGSVSTTEFQYLNSVTSNIQTQLNGKANTLPAWITGHPDTPPSSPATESDEFESSTLNVKWTESVSGAARDIHTSQLSHYWVDFTAASQSAALAQTAPSGTGLFSLTSKVFFGLTAGTGLQLLCGVEDAGSTNGMWAKVSLSGTSMQVGCLKNAGGAFTDNNTTVISPAKTHIYLHVQRNASNVWEVWVSQDGRAWFFVSTQTLSFTVAKLIWSASSGTVLTRRGKVGTDWIRYNWLTL